MGTLSLFASRRASQASRYGSAADIPPQVLLTLGHPSDRLVLAPADAPWRQLHAPGEATLRGQPPDGRAAQGRAAMHLVPVQVDGRARCRRLLLATACGHR